MKKLVFAAATLAACIAVAADAPKPAEAAAAAQAWKPRHVTKKDTKGLDALYKQVDEAYKKGDMDTVASMHDFPVFMLTDNSAGVPSAGDLWSKDQWLSTMKAANENMPKDIKMSRKQKYTFITDSLVFVEETQTATVGKGKPDSWTSGAVLVLKDGKWMFKSGIEGGWGDMMPPPAEKKAEAAPAAAPGTKTADAKPAAAPAPAAKPAPAPAK